MNRFAQGLAAVGDARRYAKHARLLVVTHQKLHELTGGRGICAGIVKGDLQEPARDVPPIDLEFVDVPSLSDTDMHQRVAPLAEPFLEEVVGDADDLAEKPTFVGVGDELLQSDAFDHEAPLPDASIAAMTFSTSFFSSS